MERKERRHHTREFKLEAVRLAAVGDKTKAKVARELGVRVNQLRQWRLDFEEEERNGVPKQKLATAEQDLGTLRRENLQSACKMGLEGVIAKRLSSPYRSTRTTDWLKIKCQKRQEFVVGGYTPRTNSRREVGSLLLGVYDDEGRLRSVGSVGTGWSSKTAEALLSELKK